MRKDLAVEAAREMAKENRETVVVFQDGECGERDYHIASKKDYRKAYVGCPVAQYIEPPMVETHTQQLVKESFKAGQTVERGQLAARLRKAIDLQVNVVKESDSTGEGQAFATGYLMALNDVAQMIVDANEGRAS